MTTADLQRQIEQAARLRSRMTVARLEAWLVAAQPGARLVYGVGGTAREAATDAVNEWLCAMAARGFVYLTQKRRASGGPQVGFDYRVTRSSRPFRKATPDEVRRRIDELANGYGSVTMAADVLGLNPKRLGSIRAGFTTATPIEVAALMSEAARWTRGS